MSQGGGGGGGGSSGANDQAPVAPDITCRQQQQQQSKIQGPVPPYYYIYPGAGVGGDMGGVLMRGPGQGVAGEQGMPGGQGMGLLGVHGALQHQQRQGDGGGGGGTMVDVKLTARELYGPARHHQQLLLQQQQQQQQQQQHAASSMMYHQQHLHNHHRQQQQGQGHPGDETAAATSPVASSPISSAISDSQSRAMSGGGIRNNAGGKGKANVDTPLLADPLGGGTGGDDCPALESLQQHYHMSLEQAARALGISLNKLKRACRQYGIPRWPYRQVRSIRSTIQSLEKALEKCESKREAASLKERLDSLVKKEALVCKFASCGLTGPVRNMLFSSKPETICDILIKDIVDQTGGSTGTPVPQDHTQTAGMKRGRGELDVMSRGGIPLGFGGMDKQCNWVPASMYRMPTMLPPNGSQLPGGAGGIDAGVLHVQQQHHRHQQQQQQPQSFFLPADTATAQGVAGYMDNHHQHRQQQLLLMQANGMPSAFVPARYETYGQAQPPQTAHFLGGGIDGLSPGLAAHQLVPYLQAQQQAQAAQQQQNIGAPGAAGDAMRIPHYAQWHAGMAGGGAATDAGMGEMTGNMVAILLQQHQQQLIQRRLQHHPQAFGYPSSQFPPVVYGTAPPPLPGSSSAQRPPMQGEPSLQQPLGQCTRAHLPCQQTQQQQQLQESLRANSGWGQQNTLLKAPLQLTPQVQQQNSHGGFGGVGGAQKPWSNPTELGPEAVAGARGGSQDSHYHHHQQQEEIQQRIEAGASTGESLSRAASSSSNSLPGWGCAQDTSSLSKLQQRSSSSLNDGERVGEWSTRSSSEDAGSGDGWMGPTGGGGESPRQSENEVSTQQQHHHNHHNNHQPDEQQKMKQAQSPPASFSHTNLSFANEAELLLATAYTDRRTAGARGSISNDLSDDGNSSRSSPRGSSPPYNKDSGGDSDDGTMSDETGSSPRAKKMATASSAASADNESTIDMSSAMRGSSEPAESLAEDSLALKPPAIGPSEKEVSGSNCCISIREEARKSAINGGRSSPRRSRNPAVCGGEPAAVWSACARKTTAMRGDELVEDNDRYSSHSEGVGVGCGANGRGGPENAISGTRGSNTASTKCEMRHKRRCHSHEDSSCRCGSNSFSRSVSEDFEEGKVSKGAVDRNAWSKGLTAASSSSGDGSGADGADGNSVVWDHRRNPQRPQPHGKQTDADANNKAGKRHRGSSSSSSSTPSSSSSPASPASPSQGCGVRRVLQSQSRGNKALTCSSSSLFPPSSTSPPSPSWGKARATSDGGSEVAGRAIGDVHQGVSGPTAPTVSADCSCGR